MTEPPVVTRFAPSPSGALHLGNVRTALFSWLAARRAPGGRFLLRIEDTDASRSDPRLAADILTDLAWFGLDWDGEVWHQSRRRAAYDAPLEQLARQGVVYPCFCTEAQLEADRRDQLARGEPPRYVGRCRELPSDERVRRATRGEPFALRFRVPASGTVHFEDLVHGPTSFRCQDLGDFVLRRGNGAPVFFFSNAIDDAAAGVTQVLRGEDHLANTPRQILLLRALNLPLPRYGHLPLLLDREGQPLSKSRGSTSLAQLRAAGYLPVAVANLLYRLGHSTTDARLLTLAEMAAGFDPAHLQRAPARVDEVQLAHWQKLAAHGLDAAARRAWLGEAVPLGSWPGLDETRREAFFAAIAGNIVLPVEAAEWADIVFGPSPEPRDEEARQAIASAPRALFAAAADAATDTQFKALAAAVTAATGLKGPALFKPLRAALTGRLAGPDLGALLPLMDPGSLRQRLARFA